MESIEQLQQRLNLAFRDLVFPSDPADLYDPIRYTLALGGKRIRPLLLLVACQTFDGNLEDAINPAIGIELFHNFTLLHDDIMDQAPLRRGKETVYKKWNPNIAILSGDTMFALANKFMAGTRPGVIQEVMNLFNQTAIEVCEGQQYDMNFESDSTVSISDYMEMIRLKTAVLLAASLKTGALVAGAEVERCNAVYRFGINLGLAFQLKDDLLDAYGSEAKFGKVTGGDILAVKKTFLYLKTIELSQNKSVEFKNLYTGNLDNPAEKIQRVKHFFDQYNIAELTNTEIGTYYQKALSDLNSLQLPAYKTEILFKFAARLMERDS